MSDKKIIDAMWDDSPIDVSSEVNFIWSMNLLDFDVLIINQVETKDECSDFIAKEKGSDLLSQSPISSLCNATDVISFYTALSTRSNCSGFCFYLIISTPFPISFAHISAYEPASVFTTKLLLFEKALSGILTTVS